MKKTFYLVAFVAMFLNGCSSSDSSSSSTSGALVKTLFTDNVNPADQDYNLLFTYSGNKLLNVKSTGVLVEEYIYTGDKLTRINYPDANTYILIEYTGSQVSKFTEFDPTLGEAVKHLVTFSGSNFTTTSYSGDLTTQALLEGTVVSTVQNGNIVQREKTHAGITSTTTYVYDTKNNPFKNIANYDVIKILLGDLDGSSNNVTVVNYQGNTKTLNYVYNADNYPTTEQTFDNSSTLSETTTYTYY